MTKRPLGTWVLYIITALGFVYLFIPLITIGLFTFNKPSGRFNTQWQEFTLENWGDAFKGSDYTDALWESIKVAIVACTLATILGGVIVVEVVFAWPGLGRLVFDAVASRDYPVIQGVILIFSGVYVLINLAIDIFYTVLDPRIRY